MIDDATDYQDQHDAHHAALVAKADVELRKIIATPLVPARASAYAASIVCLLRERNEGIGTTPTYFVDLTRTQLGVDRRRLQLPELTHAEHDVIDAASKLTHRLALKDARQRGLPIHRPRRVRGSVVRACVVIERTSPAMGVVA